jgi:23S rRNA pseudouridine1911/1915/1917 synthase
MIVTKTKEAFESLKKQFQDHEVKKIYHAFIFGELKEKEGTIDRPIGRSSKDFRMFSAQRGARGELREAITNYKVLSLAPGYSFVEVSPQTGRTHQIRVHFKAISYPLVADKVYAPKRENELGFERLALHSYKITFQDLKGKLQEIIAPYPKDFKSGLEKFTLLQ